MLRRAVGSIVWIKHVLVWMVLLAAAAVLLIAVLVPRVGGATPYTVLTGSMVPTYPPGTLVVVKPVEPQDLGIGDVITFQIESGRPAVATHRIVAQGIDGHGEYWFETQGDANNAPDTDWVKPVQIKGKLWYSVPYLGRANSVLNGEQRQYAVWAVAAGLAGYALFMFGSAARE